MKSMKSRIEDLCEKLIITQGELAKKLGVTPETISSWKQGIPPRKSNLRAIKKLEEEA